MLEFKVNKYITLKLENRESKIYVLDRFFNQCKSLYLAVSLNEINNYDVDALDDIQQKLGIPLNEREDFNSSLIIPPEDEFWGHCSNLQAWAENSLR